MARAGRERLAAHDSAARFTGLGIHVDARSGRLLGATIVARQAGDLIGEMSLAMTAGLRIGDLSRTVHPYPTVGEALRKLGDAWMRLRPTPRVRGLFERYLAMR